MEVIHSISVPLFDYHYSTVFSTIKVRVLKACEQSLHILLTRYLSLRLQLWKKVPALLQHSLFLFHFALKCLHFIVCGVLPV